MNLTLELPREKEQSEQERKDYCAAIFAIYPRLERDVKEKMYEELVKTYSINAGTSKTREEIVLATIRGNGIMEGMAILLESWQQANTEHQSPPEKEVD